MRLMLTKCRDCLGCNRMEDEKFIGDNNCGTGQECDSWSNAIDFMIEEGWKKKLVDGEWKHYCLECQESEVEEG